MDRTKIAQIKYMQQQYYKNRYIKNMAVNNVITSIKQGDVYVRIIKNVITRHNNFFKNNDIKIDLKPMQLLGCNKKQFIDHITNKLTKDMTFDNYGEWEIDHIYPISKINISDHDEIKKYCNYTNLQPLNKLDNMRKSNKI